MDEMAQQRQSVAQAAADDPLMRLPRYVYPSRASFGYLEWVASELPPAAENGAAQGEGPRCSGAIPVSTTGDHRPRWYAMPVKPASPDRLVRPEIR